jgi:hypothetical protein
VSGHFGHYVNREWPVIVVMEFNKGVFSMGWKKKLNEKKIGHGFGFCAVRFFGCSRFDIKGIWGSGWKNAVLSSTDV